MHARDAGIAFVSAGNRVDRIEDRDLCNRDGPAGPAGSELLVEHPVLARCWRRMVESAGVDCDLIPVKHLSQSIAAVRQFRLFERRNRLRGFETPPVGVSKSRGRLDSNANKKAEEGNENCSLDGGGDHVASFPVRIFPDLVGAAYTRGTQYLQVQLI